MTLKSFEIPPKPFALDDGPLLECAPPGRGAAAQPLRIRARRVFPASRDELFAAWTTRTAWESWLRLRARSRAMVAPYSGGAFRLELADGPTIHVVTGTTMEIRPDEFVSFTWIHHNTSDHGSVLDIACAPLREQSELRLLHRSIASRREAAWLMRLWASALNRLGRYFASEAATVPRMRDLARRIAQTVEPELCARGVASTVTSRHASSAA
jgi:uncharacterized protein YndB with AHSA1/START domain